MAAWTTSSGPSVVLVDCLAGRRFSAEHWLAAASRARAWRITVMLKLFETRHCVNRLSELAVRIATKVFSFFSDSDCNYNFVHVVVVSPQSGQLHFPT